jgi:hypothetical protein
LPRGYFAQSAEVREEAAGAEALNIDRPRTQELFPLDAQDVAG